MRDWEKFDNDEIVTIWKGFLNTEFPSYNNPLHLREDYFRPIRLTPMEIIKLVEELMNRLEVKFLDKPVGG